MAKKYSKTKLKFFKESIEKKSNAITIEDDLTLIALTWEGVKSKLNAA